MSAPSWPSNPQSRWTFPRRAPPRGRPLPSNVRVSGPGDALDAALVTPARVAGARNFHEGPPVVEEDPMTARQLRRAEAPPRGVNMTENPDWPARHHESEAPG